MTDINLSYNVISLFEVLEIYIYINYKNMKWCDKIFLVTYLTVSKMLCDGFAWNVYQLYKLLFNNK